jgi:hypothetical protein
MSNSRNDYVPISVIALHSSMELTRNRQHLFNIMGSAYYFGIFYEPKFTNYFLWAYLLALSRWNIVALPAS